MVTFQRFDLDARVARWAAAANAVADRVLADPAQQAAWLRHDGTWFVGVDALPNGPDGAIDGIALEGPWELTQTEWHPAQLSVTYPGYPGQDAGESEAAHRFRRDRFAAHLDGLLPEGPDKRRHLREPHAFILGVALNDAPPDAAPLVVWKGSPAIMRDAMREAFAGVDPADWGDVDVTDAYQAARRAVFAQCDPVAVPLKPGESVLVHRLAIHGVAPWESGTGDRRIAYFRPLLANPADWLT